MHLLLWFVTMFVIFEGNSDMGDWKTKFRKVLWSRWGTSAYIFFSDWSCTCICLYIFKKKKFMLACLLSCLIRLSYCQFRQMLRWNNPNRSKVPLCWLDHRQLPLLVILFWPNRKPIWWRQHRSRTRYLCLKQCVLLCRNLALRRAKFSCRHQSLQLRKQPMPHESKVELLPLWRQHWRPMLRSWTPTV